MTHITTRELQMYYPPVKCRSSITLLDRLVGTAYSKLIWFDVPNRACGATLRHINVEKAIEGLQAYLVVNQHSNHTMIKKSLSVKRRLLDVLKILKDK